MESFDKRTIQKKGHMLVVLDQPFYEPGMTVNGNVYIKNFEPLYANCIELEVKGGEKCSFWRFWQEREQRGDEVIIHERCEKVKFKGKFLEFKQPVFMIQGGVLNPGDYVISFSFQLPNNIPSSFYKKERFIREKPKGKVKYYCQIKVDGQTSDDKMKYKNTFMVRERAVDFKANHTHEESHGITVCCCCEKGQSKLTCTFEKNIFTPNEIARAHVVVDNSECEVDVKDIKFFVKQYWRLEGRAWGHHDYEQIFCLQEDHEVGPPAGQKCVRDMDIDLSKIRYEVQTTRKKKGMTVDLSPEDMFLMSGVQPACHSRHIKNHYELVCELKYDACTCCDELPDAQIPLTIIPLVNPACYGFKPVEGFMPQNLGAFNVDLRYLY